MQSFFAQNNIDAPKGNITPPRSDNRIVIDETPTPPNNSNSDRVNDSRGLVPLNQLELVESPSDDDDNFALTSRSSLDTSHQIDEV